MGMAYGRQPRLPYATCDISIIGSRLKSTKLLELCRIIPANSLPRLGPAATSMRTLQQTTWALCPHLLQPCSLQPASISHTMPSLTSCFSSCYVICHRHSLYAHRSLCISYLYQNSHLLFTSVLWCCCLDHKKVSILISITSHTKLVPIYQHYSKASKGKKPR